MAGRPSSCVNELRMSLFSSRGFQIILDNPASEAIRGGHWPPGVAISLDRWAGDRNFDTHRENRYRLGTGGRLGPDIHRVIDDDGSTTLNQAGWQGFRHRGFSGGCRLRLSAGFGRNRFAA